MLECVERIGIGPFSDLLLKAFACKHFLFLLGIKMNSSSKSFLSNNDAKLYSPNKVTSLNPNAAEFVPSLKSLSGNNKKVDGATLYSPGTSGKAVLDRSESNFSNSSDDEAHRYWHHQLPDDITPDFKIMGEEELQSPAGLSLARLSLNDGIEASRFSSTVRSQFLGKQQEISPRDSEHACLSGSGFATALLNLGTNPWNKQFMYYDQHVSNGTEGDHFGGNSNASFPNDLLNENCGLDNAAVNSVKFLPSQFPGFAVERLAKPQVENGFDQNMNSKTLSAASLIAPVFPAVKVQGTLVHQNELLKYGNGDLQRAPNMFQPFEKEGFSFLKPSTSDGSRNIPDFASSARRLPSQDSGHRKYEMNVSMDAIGLNRNPQLLASSYASHGKTVYTDMLGLAKVQAASAWLETEDAVARMYSERREEEVHDFARLQNACFEHATEAYKIGNEGLAKVHIKGQSYNIQMKAAHEKAGELIYRQRTSVTPELWSYDRGHDRLIDLHGLHVNEALHLLKHELNVLRRTARSAGKRLQVMIDVGIGHHTKGSHTLAQLPITVEQYLLDENLQFSEDQPGLIRVVIC